jgi:hypothetical protein
MDMETRDTEKKANILTRGLAISAKAFKWVTKLGSPDPLERQHALEKLKNVKDPCATSEVLKKMNDPNPAVRMAVAHYLERCCDDTAVSHLKQLLRDNDHDVRISAIYAIAKYKGSNTDMVLMLLKRGLYDHDRDYDKAGEVKEAALDVLRRFKGEKVARIIALALDDTNEKVRIESLHAGSKVNIRVFQQHLIDSLNDQEDSVRNAAKALLVEHKNNEIKLKLMKMYAKIVVDAHGKPETFEMKNIREVLENMNDSKVTIHLHALNHPEVFLLQQILASLEGRTKSLPPLLNGEEKKTGDQQQ